MIAYVARIIDDRLRDVCSGLVKGHFLRFSCNESRTGLGRNVADMRVFPLWLMVNSYRNNLYMEQQRTAAYPIDKFEIRSQKTTQY